MNATYASESGFAELDTVSNSFTLLLSITVAICSGIKVGGAFQTDSVIQK